MMDLMKIYYNFVTKIIGILLHYYVILFIVLHDNQCMMKYMQLSSLMSIILLIGELKMGFQDVVFMPIN